MYVYKIFFSRRTENATFINYLCKMWCKRFIYKIKHGYLPIKSPGTNLYTTSCNVLSDLKNEKRNKVYHDIINVQLNIASMHNYLYIQLTYVPNSKPNLQRERKTQIKRGNRWNMKEIHCKGNIFLIIWNSIILRKLSQQKFVELRNRNWNGEKNKIGVCTLEQRIYYLFYISN